jgi:hypothetical protein
VFNLEIRKQLASSGVKYIDLIKYMFLGRNENWFVSFIEVLIIISLTLTNPAKP